MENTIVILHEEQLTLGNSFDVLKGMLDNSKGGFVCDPPYGISFMSKKWDDPTAMANAMADPTAAFAEPDEKEPTVAELVAFQRWAEVWLAEVYRVLMPGGVAKVFSATRTFHRIGAAMEKVGFKDIDLEAWTYGSGFPKSLNISKAIDRMNGAEREKVRIPSDQIRNPKSINGGHGIDGGDRPYMQKAQELGYHERDSDVSVTVDAKRYDGFGTAMKPAWEPFLVGIKA